MTLNKRCDLSIWLYQKHTQKPGLRQTRMSSTNDSIVTFHPYHAYNSCHWTLFSIQKSILSDKLYENYSKLQQLLTQNMDNFKLRG